MCLALLAFLHILKDNVKYGNLLLNPIMLFKTEVLSSLTVSIYLGYSALYSSALSVLRGQI